MKGRLFVLIVLIVGILIFCESSSFAYYSFLSSGTNKAIEALKEKHRVKEIVLEREGKIVWIVFLPRNDEIIISQVQEEIEGHIYTMIEITIVNAKGESRIIWGFAAKEYPYNIPRLCFPLDS